MTNSNRIDRYTCEEMFRRLDDFVDRELPPQEMEHAREHLESCAACAKEYAFATSMLDELKMKLRRIDVPGDFARKVAQELAKARGEA